MRGGGLPVRRRINRIRNYYKQIAGEEARLFLLSGHDDGPGVFGNAALPAEGRRHFFSFASVVALINGVVAGSTLAIAIANLADAPLAVAASAGAALGLLSVALFVRHAERLLRNRAGIVEAIFPSPPYIDE